MNNRPIHQRIQDLWWMLLLISDANILIDMEAGALMGTLFQLPMQFGIPDLLYYEEIEPGSPGLENLGLQIMEVSGDFVAYAQQLPAQHNHLLRGLLVFSAISDGTKS